MDIVALPETRLDDSGKLEEVSEGFTFFWKGKAEEEVREAGVGVAIRSSLVSLLEELPVDISERIMTLRQSLNKDRWATMLSIYAPTMSCSDEAKLSFYS